MSHSRTARRLSHRRVVARVLALAPATVWPIDAIVVGIVVLVVLLLSSAGGP
jgi:hypothetical protein